ncbi:MAG: UDP-N-acetylmuramate dehydrogenase [Zymomonas mobilis subsp. pomaceae]|uniref:UDP-N-acetylenolpyruvoylglucosamine reductase n=1 Tax=Zymomonas mobilis subsp. pomaceae (strain ATCC 29192 / DSM 22645 / JCM 10191 / CCUG 17912 / NBRC 13757 / NCIMB 11200 / NRRL B-4491 / Barker I) TaxID=579138 RepID=F8EVC6_ZYMMT|nr:UDP-N-acetylmuramate dehydrogenase [Zymomonas mobilis]AEI37333.1 UDP-N-acetylenolpyruvoylglucosamine reductase [Zymomonas mobilis subsp. pomaceae ATCC 29192]MDX5948701.1 UDP-N-acetylmuramate dehydrogenase [Zymomonas mobilis subsp. pomaceae]GEB88506.1 UDP-N-acetylenolpyruvoylglucosamine reductase [Zymomonas mobilis subsp. pomaceae]
MNTSSKINTLPAIRGEIEANASLAPLTWFRVGGKAEWLVRPADTEDLSEFLKALDPAIPVMVLGIGSNVIIRDGGVKGVIIRLSRRFSWTKLEAGNRIRCGGATLGLVVSKAACDAALTGLEFLRGIPGSLGGMIRMNAGAYEGDISKILIEATLVRRSGEIEIWPAEKLEFAYRYSALPEDAIITEALFQGQTGDKAAIEAKMARIVAEREMSQPLRSRTGGSTFKNPEGHKAWQLIDEAGCRGLRIGDAQVSEKHANFLLNLGEASAADVENLGEEVRARVKAKSGITLEWEIKRIGFKAEQESAS